VVPDRSYLPPGYGGSCRRRPGGRGQPILLRSADVPARVIPSQPPNKITYLVADTWAARKVRIRPVPADQATVPGQQRARRDDAMLPQLAGKPADEGGQHGPVRPGQTWPGNLATQHRDLMAQHHQLSDHRGLATRHLRQPAEYPNRSQVQQPNNHGPDPAPPAAKPQPTPCANSSGTVQAWQAGVHRRMDHS
jgi:hypothetical protein